MINKNFEKLKEITSDFIDELKKVIGEEDYNLILDINPNNKNGFPKSLSDSPFVTLRTEKGLKFCASYNFTKQIK